MIGESAPLIAAFAMGLVVGAAFFWSLWIALRRLSRTAHAQFWLIGSSALRVGLMLLAWYWIAGGQWQKLLACLVAFVVVRLAAVRWAAIGKARPVAR